MTQGCLDSSLPCTDRVARSDVTISVRLICVEVNLLQVLVQFFAVPLPDFDPVSRLAAFPITLVGAHAFLTQHHDKLMEKLPDLVYGTIRPHSVLARDSSLGLIELKIVSPTVDE